MFGWTQRATSVYMWFVCFGTAVEPEMKATQDQENEFQKNVGNPTYLMPEPYGFKHTNENFRNLSL